MQFLGLSERAGLGDHPRGVSAAYLVAMVMEKPVSSRSAVLRGAGTR